jgi:hypothetical protein
MVFGKPHRVRTRAVRDQGQVLPLVALLLAIAVGSAVLVALVGRVVDDRARAVTAADAAALAGAAEGPDAAEELARRNGGVLEEFRREGPDTVVVVRVGRARAQARARAEPTAPIATWIPP